MKANEARPLFRTLALCMALPCWAVLILLLMSVNEAGVLDWQFASGMLVGAVSFSYIAFAGYMPKFLLGLFSYGAVRDKNLK
ncbi:hypothetical protein [Pseudoalteromonas luteoviolacea]|uniref:Uncharacterized protein n=1 Tax=Pseudoalteromonas luteoviolacea S4060-1 TaxID=1365257 RepID=A0A167JVD4_9GAMM|nr:hypothetical protein [Pseudoalteromonas luteoviolacea]KZN61725.1 hypothetical protein N478_06570 [Pseudoalteromonas luteoviolacea S4060-1]